MPVLYCLVGNYDPYSPPNYCNRLDLNVLELDLFITALANFIRNIGLGLYR
jgi:hypothetical protein